MFILLEYYICEFEYKLKSFIIFDDCTILFQTVMLKLC